MNNSQDGSGVPYATVIITGTNFGTITDFSGRFELKRAKTADSVRISAVGFTSASFAITELSSSVPLLLQPASYELTTVEVNAYSFSKAKTVGGTPQSEKIVCFFLHGQEGEQIGRQLKLGRESLAQSARISVVDTNADSVLCRLRFYQIFDDSVSTDPIVHPDVFLKIVGEGIIEVDLKPYEIVLPAKVLMAVELIDPPVEKQFIYFGGALFKPSALYRVHSGAPWRAGSTSKKAGKRGLLTMAPGFELTVLR